MVPTEAKYVVTVELPASINAPANVVAKLFLDPAPWTVVVEPLTKMIVDPAPAA